jgi:TetR/AcrR family transcriptional regulator, transcriptional repressor for nem operon
MPYPAEHRQQIRTRILDSARRLFNRNGLTEVSIDVVMAGAGLTRGGFYSYFSSKEALYAEAITQFVRCNDRPDWQRPVFAQPAQGQAQGQTMARAILDAYLSRAHLDDVEGSCPMIGLATDVARGDGTAKAAYREVMGMMVGIFAENFGPDAFSPGNHPPDPAADRARALAVVALCVGGMVLARAVDDPATADALRAAARQYAVALAGWQEHPPDR